MKTKILILSQILLLFMLTNSCNEDDDNNANPTPTPTPAPTTVTDIDGNVYHIVTIGTQVWMVENLKTTQYRNGEAIYNVSDNYTWSSLTFGAYCNYDNDANNAAIYGRLYNWYAVNDSRNIAPAGWHVPSDAEWQTLVDYLGGGTIAGGKMKETGTTHWNSPNTGADNSSGFTALPGGNRNMYDYNGAFHYIGEYGQWWSTTGDNTTSAWYRTIHYDGAEIYRTCSDKTHGFYVRCVKD